MPPKKKIKLGTRCSSRVKRKPTTIEESSSDSDFQHNSESDSDDSDSSSSSSSSSRSDSSSESAQSRSSTPCDQEDEKSRIYEIEPRGFIEEESKAAMSEGEVVQGDDDQSSTYEESFIDDSSENEDSEDVGDISSENEGEGFALHERNFQNSYLATKNKGLLTSTALKLKSFEGFPIQRITELGMSDDVVGRIEKWTHEDIFKAILKCIDMVGDFPLDTHNQEEWIDGKDFLNSPVILIQYLIGALGDKKNDLIPDYRETILTCALRLAPVDVMLMLVNEIDGLDFEVRNEGGFSPFQCCFSSKVIKYVMRRSKIPPEEVCEKVWEIMCEEDVSDNDVCLLTHILNEYQHFSFPWCLRAFYDGKLKQSPIPQCLSPFLNGRSGESKDERELHMQNVPFPVFPLDKPPVYITNETRFRRLVYINVLFKHPEAMVHWVKHCDPKYKAASLFAWFSLHDGGYLKLVDTRKEISLNRPKFSFQRRKSLSEKEKETRRSSVMVQDDASEYGNEAKSHWEFEDLTRRFSDEDLDCVQKFFGVLSNLSMELQMVICNEMYGFKEWNKVTGLLIDTTITPNLVDSASKYAIFGVVHGLIDAAVDDLQNIFDEENFSEGSSVIDTEDEEGAMALQDELEGVQGDYLSESDEEDF